MHVETVHEGKRYKCLICDYAYSRKQHLKRHYDLTHEGKKPHTSPQFVIIDAQKTGF